MDALCSRSELNEGYQSDESTKEAGALTTMARFPRSTKKLPASHRIRQREMAAARSLTDAHDADISALAPAKQPAWRDINPDAGYASVDDYLALRSQILYRKRALDFDFSCRNDCSPDKRRAEDIIQRLKHKDKAGVYNAAPPRTGFNGQKHPRFAGDHFLSNLALVN
ncbi:hypothetical protein AUP68_11382 [Ilyonectria robusta]